MGKKISLNRLQSKSIGGTNNNELLNLEMRYLIDDDVNQIIMSPALFNAFKNSSKNKKNYNESSIKNLFKYIVLLYNDTIQENDKYGGLTYLEKISDCLDYLTIENITELSLGQINLLLDCENVKDVVKVYQKILTGRHSLDMKSDYKLYKELLKNNGNFDSKLSKKVYTYISTLYNDNTILQDNVDYHSFLGKMAILNQENILSMRMYQFLDMFNLYNINHEAVNEARGLINDLSDSKFIVLQ